MNGIVRSDYGKCVTQSAADGGIVEVYRERLQTMCEGEPVESWIEVVAEYVDKAKDPASARAGELMVHLTSMEKLIAKKIKKPVEIVFGGVTGSDLFWKVKNG